MSAATEPGTAGSGRTPIDLPLAGGGMTFIEASAGTGKTHALTTLVARLVIEEGWPLDRILVVTFTRAATAELRDRIRRVLGVLLAAVKARALERDSEAQEQEQQQEIDPQARELLCAWERRKGGIDLAQAARRLQAAMHDIDRANVYTIHAFCQRVLADLAFESGFPFGCEVSGGDGEMVAGAVRDFWRRRLYPASMLLTRYTVDSGFLPGGLTSWVSSRRAKTGVTILGGDPLPEPIEAREAAWREVFEAVRIEWEQHRGSFRAEILEGRWLNRARYRRNRTERELAGIEALFAAPEPRLPENDAVGRYGREQLSQVCKRNFTLPENPLFDAFDRLEEASGELRSAYEQWLRWMRREALADVRESVRRRIRDDRRLAYDDLLIELHDALESAGGARLAGQIRHEFPCALIDEYQDTDPLQTRIFSRIYGEARTGAAGEGWAEEGDPTGVWGSRPSEPAAGEGCAEEGDPTGAWGSRPSEPAAGEGWAEEGDPTEVWGSRPGEPAHVEAAGQSDLAGKQESERDERIEHGSASRSIRTGRAPSGPFIVVGDPKQSIYRFRGADVFAYLAARRTARERLHLERNWRSVPALVEAVNAVFAGAAAFVTPEIEYRPVAAARDGGNPLRIATSEGGGPLELWLYPRSEEDKLLTKKDVNPVVAGATANEIVRLLELGARGEVAIEGEPFTGADIAVLVRTRDQGRLVAGALHERGVRSIEIDDGSVFDTREAEQIERLLWALAEPRREMRVRGALAGDLFGLDARALLALGDDEEAWGSWSERLAGWRTHWESRGIGSVLLQLLEREGGARRLLGHRDGARRLTNYRHLAELLQEAETRERFAPAEFAAWLSHRRVQSDRGDDSVQLRIESDEQLVKILTMHGSKGLEFPVVFCPFAWDARSPRRRPEAVDAVYHLGEADDYREVLDLDPNERSESIQRLEEFSESVRLLYVALTRAKYRCVVAWGQVRGAEHAPLAWLLHRSGGSLAAMTGPGRGGSESGSGAKGPGATVAAPERGPGAEGPGAAVAAPERDPGRKGPEAVVVEPESSFGTEGPDASVTALKVVADRLIGLSAADWLGEIHAWARRFPDAVSVNVLDPEPPPILAPVLCEGPPLALAAREPGRPLRRIRSLTSFSALAAEALSAGGGPGRPPADRDDAEADRPDHDQREEPADASGEETDASGAMEHERTAFTFPRGPVAGSCLHRIFEQLDTSPEIGPEKLDLDEICREALEDFGIDGDWRSVARTMVERTRAMRLHEPEREGPGGEGGWGGSIESSGSDGSSGEADSVGAAGSGGEAGSRRKVSSGGEVGPGGASRAVRAGGFRLDGPIRRLVELEFHFPVEGLDRGRLGARLVEHGYPDPFARPARSEAIESPPPPIHGFLRGYIDLVVEHAGRWYVLDYKSNWLGPGPGSYAPEALAATMCAGGYTFQSLIYLVALHRYLTVRLPGYEYERHVGGAFYLFVRGIDPAAGTRRGVYFDRPSAACLHALDDCFRGDGA